jgi:hypothetical protein
MLSSPRLEAHSTLTHVTGNVMLATTAALVRVLRAVLGVALLGSIAQAAHKALWSTVLALVAPTRQPTLFTTQPERCVSTKGFALYGPCFRDKD